MTNSAATPDPLPTAPGAAVFNHQSKISNHKSRDPAWVRVTLTALALLALTVLVVVPVVSVFYEALAEGVGTYWKNLTADSDTRHSVLVTLIVAPLAVLCNLVFGVAA